MSDHNSPAKKGKAAKRPTSPAAGPPSKSRSAPGSSASSSSDAVASPKKKSTMAGKRKMAAPAAPTAARSKDAESGTGKGKGGSKYSKIGLPDLPSASMATGSKDAGSGTSKGSSGGKSKYSKIGLPDLPSESRSTGSKDSDSGTSKGTSGGKSKYSKIGLPDLPSDVSVLPLDSLEQEINSLYQDVLLRPGHDNSEMLDMVGTNKGLSGGLVLSLLTFMKKVATEVEAPGKGDLPADMKDTLSGMTIEEKRKKMASFLIVAEGLVKRQELGLQQKACNKLKSDIQTICNRFLDNN